MSKPPTVPPEPTAARLADWRAPILIVLGKREPWAVELRWIVSIAPAKRNGQHVTKVTCRNGYVHEVDEPWKTVFDAVRDGLEAFTNSRS